MQLPRIPLVIATGLPSKYGKSRCSTEAKKAFMSSRAIARFQLVCSKLSNEYTLYAYTISFVRDWFHIFIWLVPVLYRPFVAPFKTFQCGFGFVNESDDDPRL